MLKTIVSPSANILWIGYVGENKVRQMAFNLKPWYEQFGPGQATLSIQGPNDHIGHLAITQQINNALIWNVTQTDTMASGAGKLKLNYYVNTNLVTSHQIKTLVTN